MADLTKDDVLKLARLARLRLTGEEVAAFQKEITAILNYVGQLQKVDVDGLQPTYQVTGLKNVMRSDEPIEYGPSPEALLKNAPAVEKGYIKVRRMVD